MIKKLHLLLVLSILGLTGCEETNLQGLEGWVGGVKSRQPEKVRPLPEVKPYEAFVYQAIDLRSPFINAFQDVAETTEITSDNGIRPDAARVREVLEGYPLDTLSMVGVLRNDLGVWAIIRDKEGTVYRIARGNYLGTNHGRVDTIEQDRIELTEIIPDGRGGWMERPTTLGLDQ
ncbi:pilus assembly protein PilP [Pelagibaculum spongiae]|uniref:Pilus assembly protein PilP n=1 Tax=Pelagibaculum spongiae TaxID=2080658 RepID=A0A2V1GYZ2_9GAMM|nr:pilus assembly protein PilP [Pelagibaculum spongiae]PVZ68276.1 pilus assembly protein PilP [Pelagibaculum spongiae]